MTHHDEDDGLKELLDQGEFVTRQGSGAVAAGGNTLAVTLDAPCPAGWRWELRLLNWYGFPSPMTVVAGSAEAYIASERAQIGQVSPHRLIDGSTVQAGPAIGAWTGKQAVCYPGELIVVVFRGIVALQQMIVNAHFEQLPLTPTEQQRHGRRGRRSLLEAEVAIDVVEDEDTPGGLRHLIAGIGHRG